VKLKSPSAVVRYQSAQGRWLLAATIVGSSLTALDGTVVNIALPAIGRDLGAKLATMQWIVIAYDLSVSSLLLLAGALGDQYGLRRVFLIGVVWFAASSVLCGLAPSGEVLIAGRIIQGMGGALLTPGSLALLEASFHPEDRTRAIGAWSGWGGAAVAIGPFLGGYLIDAASWRFIFFMNIPLAAWVWWLVRRHVSETRKTAHRALDWPGALIAGLGLGGITFAAIEAPSLSRPQTIGILVASAACLAGFVAIERRSTHPMMPLELFRNPMFAGANAVTLAVYAGLSASFFLLPLHLQGVLHYSALASGMALLPVTALMLLLSASAGRLSQRIGPRLPMTFGCLLVGVGICLLGRVQAGTGFVDTALPALVVFGLGLALMVAPLTATVMGAVPSERSGIASAINNAVAYSAGLLAIAVLPLAAGLSGPGGNNPMQLESGFHRAMNLSAGLCIVGAIVAFLTIRASKEASSRPCRMHCAVSAPPLQEGIPPS